MNLIIGFSGLGALILLMLLRVPLGVTMGVVSFGGIWMILGDRAALGIFTSSPFEFTASWSLSSIPMFVFMGFICYHAGVTESLFMAVKRGLRRLSGGLGIAAIGGAAAFSAVCGSSLATAAAMGRIAIPEMVRNGYNPAFAGALVATGGTLGTMIPPSIIMILYGIFAEVSISKLFIAGILPGLLSAVMFCICINLRVRFQPSLVQFKGDASQEVNVSGDVDASTGSWKDVWPIVVLFVSIMGGLFAGLFSAAEAGAVGAFVALLIAWPRKQFNREAFKRAVLESLETTASIFFIGIGAILFTRFLALSGVADYLSNAVINLTTDPLVFVIGVSIVYLILGMFIDPIGIMLLTLPLLFPIMQKLGIDLIWMGVLIVKYLELAMITPPVGLNLFVIKSMMPKTSLEQIIRQVTWFILTDIITMCLLIAFPKISTFLPSLLN
ncbi:MAG: TRAP transporter large permease subunit [Ferrovibrio sp.]|uniref:TRAP transporter large permease n=1 Tax=Ferrovibrio sp. TaxID=1917215 RepID=UPI0026302E18|nr:TRAP transporter large permease subunit [Ferrovibrio sp.]MCW0235002.1 TRAP transporter large permease subunit [Ferrovibrio sp.]